MVTNYVRKGKLVRKFLLALLPLLAIVPILVSGLVSWRIVAALSVALLWLISVAIAAACFYGRVALRRFSELKDRVESMENLTANRMTRIDSVASDVQRLVEDVQGVRKSVRFGKDRIVKRLQSNIVAESAHWETQDRRLQQLEASGREIESRLERIEGAVAESIVGIDSVAGGVERVADDVQGTRKSVRYGKDRIVKRLEKSSSTEDARWRTLTEELSALQSEVRGDANSLARLDAGFVQILGAFEAERLRGADRYAELMDRLFDVRESDVALDSRGHHADESSAAEG